MLNSLFRTRPEKRMAEALYVSVAAQARAPAFYTALGVPDQIDARFELYTLHVTLLIERLKDDGPQGAEIGQRLFDIYVSALDDSLRELGVGDLSVAKKMRKLGEALYGRMTVYAPALAQQDESALAMVLARNVHGVEGADGARGLARYALAAKTALALQPLAVLAAQPDWPEINPEDPS
ncbi:ubiquinol-cytochrome C chaperone [Rhizobium sp. CRIBSB]|nr:ubiquinol-cytochrome C chaperone [Rhizobium sp. CRIBSB]